MTAPTLTEFLLARIAEDEEWARKAAFGYGPDWRVEIDSAEDWAVVHADSQRDMVGCEDGDVTTHIARHDPARVLAECEAKRRIVGMADDATGLDMQVDGEFRVGPRDESVEPYVGDVILRNLAAVYADHPDFDESWRA